MDFLSNKRKLIIIVLFGAHTLLVSGHMYLNFHNMINPWKFGGYAMYVQPNQSMQIRIYSTDDRGVFVEEFADIGTLYERNLNFNYYCRSVTTSSLDTFFAENTHLLNKDITMYFYSPRFYDDPLRIALEYRGVISITWIDEAQFQYQQDMCAR
jgi:hypothetical protein